MPLRRAREYVRRALARRNNEIAQCREELRLQSARVEEYANKMEESFTAVMGLVATLVEIRDAYTAGHSLRVSNLSCELAKRLGFSPDMVTHLGQACLLHDIGKIRMSDAVLLKAGRLSIEEAEIMRRHPEDGAEILNRLPVFRKYLPVVRSHHERYDGEGYPAGLKGEQIPVSARVVAIADAFDAMTTNRPYRDAMTTEAAVLEVLTCRGSQFDPDMGREFVEMVRTGGLH
jgi:putative nucleotidyltransferase with HDIG domain